MADSDRKLGSVWKKFLEMMLLYLRNVRSFPFNRPNTWPPILLLENPLRFQSQLTFPWLRSRQQDVM